MEKHIACAFKLPYISISEFENGKTTKGWNRKNTKGGTERIFACYLFISY